ncbi:piggyBac transposable element-derived protein 4 [Trichonephila clavipes]|nr:piggyBac transposable element-derived protein 4 [Trichonephila clavipes]
MVTKTYLNLMAINLEVINHKFPAKIPGSRCQVNKSNRSLDQLTFRTALARHLIDAYSSRKGKRRPASFQAKKRVVPDDARLSREGNHVPKMVSNYRRCRKYHRKGQDKRTR